MAGFSVKDMLNKNNKVEEETPKARFRTRDIPISKMYRNEMNFYEIKEIEELAGKILMYGLKQNLEVVHAPCEKGEYKIVSGERRWEALKYLVAEGYKEFELATCKLTSPQDADEEQVEIIIANAYRTKSVSDLLEEEARLKASLEHMKASGKKIKGYDLENGRLRDVIASILHVSKTKVAQMETINHNLIPEGKEALKKEEIGFSAAYELSGMPVEEQKKILQHPQKEITHKEIKTIKQSKILEPVQEQEQSKMPSTHSENVSDCDTEESEFMSQSDIEEEKEIVPESDTKEEIPGQFCIEDYPEVLPTKAAEPIKELEQKTEQKNVIKLEVDEEYRRDCTIKMGNEFFHLKGYRGTITPMEEIDNSIQSVENILRLLKKWKKEREKGE